ncbi:MAG: helix-turn-helix transcriptional regulator [Solirubrobacteraceae bacterium]
MPSATVDIDDVAQAVGALSTEHGGGVTVAQLRDKLGLSERTLQRALSRLVASGEISRLSRDRYADRTSGVSLSSAPAREIVRVIKHLEADAHLSGYDVLAGFTHQFVFDYPHLVCCHPSHADGVAAALAKKKFVVLPAGPGAAIDAALQKTVLLRRQPAIHSRTLVQGTIATPEKAWVDLLRETRRSAAPFDYGELGRLLGAMSEQTLNFRALRSYAARLGYQDWLAAAIGQRPPNGAAQRRLAAGYAA